MGRHALWSSTLFAGVVLFATDLVRANDGIRVGDLSTAAAANPAPEHGPPKYTTAEARYERFMRDVIDPFLASRAWGDERVIEVDHGKDGYSRATHDIAHWYDPAWDDAALAFLRNWGKLVHELPNAPRPDALVNEGWAVYDAGCREPMVVYAYGWALEKNNKPQTARFILQRAASGMQLTVYPLKWHAAVFSRHAGNLTRLGFSRMAANIHGGAASRLLRAIDAGEFEDEVSRRSLVAKLVGRVRGVPLDVATDFIGQVEGRDGVDPYALDVALGWFNISRAWGYRGSGLANTVTPEGWAGFHKHLDLSQDHFARAYELDPTRPEAAAGMVGLVRVNHAPEGTDLLTWLDRVVAAQMDYRPAFKAALGVLQPRWGGSHEATVDLGLACAGTERFDTELPLVYLSALRQVVFDGMHSGRWVLESPELYDVLVAVTDGMAEHPNHHHRAGWLRSARLAFAFQAGRLEEAAEVARDLGDDVDVLGLQFFGMSLEDVDRVAGTSLAASSE